jgi:hypothetical protein
MRCALLLGVFCLLCLTSWAAAQSYVSVWGAEDMANQGTSSWFGNVGMIVTPTASTPPAGAATVGYHWVDRSLGSTNVACINFGATDWLELGGAWMDTPGATDTYANVKIRLPIAQWLNSEGMPDLAVGAVDLTDEFNRALYFVVSKSFPLNAAVSGSPRISLHAGFADNELNAGALDGFFAGLEFNVNNFGLVQAEYDGDSLNADLRYNITKNLSLDLGVLDGDLGLGATYRSGL